MRIFNEMCKMWFKNVLRGNMLSSLNHRYNKAAVPVWFAQRRTSRSNANRLQLPLKGGTFLFFKLLQQYCKYLWTGDSYITLRQAFAKSTAADSSYPWIYQIVLPRSLRLNQLPNAILEVMKKTQYSGPLDVQCSFFLKQ